MLRVTKTAERNVIQITMSLLDAREIAYVLSHGATDLKSQDKAAKAYAAKAEALIEGMKKAGLA